MSQQARNFSQDMPPPGGFGNVKIDYRVQKKGFSNITLLAITSAVIVFGLGRYVYYQKKENELRMARVEERTEYAHKMDAYFKQKQADRQQLLEDVLHGAVEKRKAKLAAQQ